MYSIIWKNGSLNAWGKKIEEKNGRNWGVGEKKDPNSSKKKKKKKSNMNGYFFIILRN